MYKYFDNQFIRVYVLLCTLDLFYFIINKSTQIPGIGNPVNMTFYIMPYIFGRTVEVSSSGGGRKTVRVGRDGIAERIRIRKGIVSMEVTT